MLLVPTTNHHPPNLWTVATTILFGLLLVATEARSFSFSKTTTATKATVDTVWSAIESGPPDAILGIAQAFRECPAVDSKVNICVGAYRDENGQPWVLPSVRAAEQLLLEENANKEYLPIEGDADFIEKALIFAYGQEIMEDTTIAAVQTLSGTGACRIGGQFLSDFYAVGSNNNNKKKIYIPTPTWGNHWKIFEACGLNCQAYRYYDRTTNALDIDGLLEDISKADDGSIILLHACAHNPTGCDPSIEQWKEILKVMETKGHVAFFDSAYQGFASGDAEKDAAVLRLFVQQKTVPVLLAQSFAKNFGLYGERCGTLSVVCNDATQAAAVKSRLQGIIRPMYSSPPKHGSSIVKTVLNHPTLSKQYYQECQQMADRIASMRSALVETLAKVGSKHDWSHITQQIGMFAYTGMTSEMVDALTAKYHIYMTRDGRVSLAGLTPKNIEYVAKAIHEVTDGKSITQAEP